MEKEFRTLKTKLSLPYELAYGDTWTRFFEGFQNKTIYGTRCPECGRVLVPARSFCPRCFVALDEWLPVSQEGTLTTWSLTNYHFFGMPTEPPFVGILIRLDGTDVDFMHLLGGVDLSDLEQARKNIHTGMKLKAVWKDTAERKGHILDLKYFEPV